MASSNIIIKLEIRPCIAKGNKAIFHKWSDKSNVIGASALPGGHNGGTVKHTVGIVEYLEDGSVNECYPYEIKFLDTAENAKHLFLDIESEGE